MFNNETGLHEKEDAAWDGDWFDDQAQNLYIVPQNGECEGPDNEIMDAINAACRDHGFITQEDQETIGLFQIPDALKRFSPEDGYYHA